MWRFLAGSTVLVLIAAHVSAADGPRILGDAAPNQRLAVRRSVEGAAVRLTRERCRQVFHDFAVPADADHLNMLRFVADPATPHCEKPVLAYTVPGAYVVHVCPLFVDRSFADPKVAEIVVIHELLHSLGLGENPPTSYDITRQVMRRCGM